MIILVYSSVSFNTCIDLCNHLHNQDTEQFHCPKSLYYPVYSHPPLTPNHIQGGAKVDLQLFMWKIIQ